MKLSKKVLLALIVASLNFNVQADNSDSHDAKTQSGDFSHSQSISNDRVGKALQGLRIWIKSLEERLPKETDNAVEKIVALIDQPKELSSMLWDVLAQSEQQFEPDEKEVFGAKLESFPLEDRQKLVVAWTSELQDFLRKRVVTISDKLSKKDNPKVKELSEAIRNLSKAHFEGYDKYKEVSKKSSDPKLFCFACDGHIGDFNYHENMEEKIKAALSGWSTSRGSFVGTAPEINEQKKDKPTLSGEKPAGAPAEKGSFEKYRASLTNGRPSPSMYPQPENMATVLGLTSTEGYSYLRWKGPGQHFVSGPQGKEYGVQIDWALLKAQSLQEQKRILGIFDQVLQAGVQPFKVVRPNNDGYCLWCNLGNYGPSKAELNSLRARVR